jgi:predicted  nucleic acid-binding Zn-ribbon protein
MRKPVQAALLTVLALFVVATGVLFVKYRNTVTAYANAKASEADVQQRYAKTIDAIAEIQDSLSAISLGDANVKMTSNGLQSEQQLSGPDKAQALDRIAVLRSSILRSKERIRQLESSLKVSGNKVAGLQKMIANLKQTVTEKEQLVTELSTRVDSLQTQVTGLATQVQESEETIKARDQAIEDKRRELATVYYLVGSKKDLTAKGAVVAKGGVLGIAKTLLPAPSVNLSAFNTIDTDQETVINIGTPKAQVISAQPSDSYELKLVDGKMELHILNPVEFRRIKQVVIMTA